MVKAASLGSSVGVTKVKTKADFKKAVDEAFKYDDEMLAEEFVVGREIECAVLGNNPPEASYPGEIVISKNYDFYTFDAKYVDPEAVQIHVPAKLSKAIAEKIRTVSNNTKPGFTGSSIRPIALPCSISLLTSVVRNH